MDPRSAIHSILPVGLFPLSVVLVKEEMRLEGVEVRAID